MSDKLKTDRLSCLLKTDRMKKNLISLINIYFIDKKISFVATKKKTRLV